MSRRLVIDTDIGTDVDDLWTLAMVPGIPQLDLAAVTLVYGDTDLRARMAAAVLAAMGIDVPVHRGCEATLSGKDIMWAGHEGRAVSGIDDASYSPVDAVDALIASAAAEPGTLDILAIGPLTNIATAIRREPSFAGNVRRLVVMGGEFAIGWPEHNFASDVVATRIVLGAGIPMTLVPLDQTLKVPIVDPDVDRIAAVHPLGPLMADEARTFWQFLAGLRAGLPERTSWAHDPLALLVWADPDAYTCTRMSVEVRDDGTVTGVVDESASIDVLTDFDPVAAHAAFLRALGCA